MIAKQTILIPADSAGVWLVRVFHLYGGFRKNYNSLGEFNKISVRKTKANNWVKKKKKIVSINIRLAYNMQLLDGSSMKFKTNNCILLKRRLTPKGNFVVGPIPIKINRKKFAMNFPGRL